MNQESNNQSVTSKRVSMTFEEYHGDLKKTAEAARQAGLKEGVRQMFQALKYIVIDNTPDEVKLDGMPLEYSAIIDKIKEAFKSNEIKP